MNNQDERNAVRKKTGLKRRRRRKRKYLFYYILLFLVVAVGGVTLSMTVFFNTAKFEIPNTGVYTAEEILAQSGVQKGDNLVRLDPKSVEKRIRESLVYCDEVMVQKKLPSTLLIDFTPAQATYNYLIGGKYAYVSKGGRVLETNQDTPAEGGMVVVGIDIGQIRQGEWIHTADEERMKLLDRLQTELSSAGFTDITQIDLTDTANLKIRYEDRITIEIQDASESSYIINAAKSILTNNISSGSKGRIFYVESTRSIHFLPDSDG